ncbi:MAG: peptidoglycan-binding protein [Pyrinomonadaceae bacterium MAG19_C2-C3]|nr:peptidoglycan-binding protein [Pyrinomonadaceae bacterium MAG19_C2-C3]
MKKSLLLLCCAVLCLATGIVPAQQTATTPAEGNSVNRSSPAVEGGIRTRGATTAAPRKRGPVFRANQEQVAQAVKLLRDRQMYTGEDSKKLTPDIRAGLKKYQEAEGIKPTGTLNKATLEKMNIALTDKQKAM